MVKLMIWVNGDPFRGISETKMLEDLGQLERVDGKPVAPFDEIHV